MIAILFAAVVASPLHSSGVSWESGNSLLRMCTDRNGADACLGYVEGVADAMTAGVPVQGVRACIPQGTEAGQLRDLAVKYLQENITSRTTTAARLVAISFAIAYPCPSSP